MGSNASVLQWRCKTCTFSLNPTERSTCSSCGNKRDFETMIENVLKNDCQTLESREPSIDCLYSSGDLNCLHLDESDELSTDDHQIHNTIKR